MPMDLNTIKKKERRRREREKNGTHLRTHTHWVCARQQSHQAISFSCPLRRRRTYFRDVSSVYACTVHMWSMDFNHIIRNIAHGVSRMIFMPKKTRQKLWRNKIGIVVVPIHVVRHIIVYARVYDGLKANSKRKFRL